MTYHPQKDGGLTLPKRIYSRSHLKLYEKIKYLMILRVVIITTFLVGALFLFEWDEYETARWFLLELIIFFYGLTIIYSLFLNRVSNLRTFAYIQILGDILFETGLIFISGAISSPLSFLYILSIITASILLYTYGAYIIASMSCIAYGILAALVQNKILDPYEFLSGSGSHFLISANIFTASEVLYRIFVNFCSFYLIAYLTNYLMEGIRKTSQELDTKEEDLIRLQKLNENILRSIDSGLISLDLEGTIVSFNLAAERISQYNAYELIGKKAQDFFPVNDIITAQTSNSPQQYRRIERIFQTRTGKDLYLGFSLSRLINESGENTGYIIIFQDLTDYKKLEAAKQRADKMAVLGELAARMAHEIRNPLTSMKGSIEVISNDLPVNSSNEKLMKIVLRESERLNRLISDFLQYAQPHKLITQKFCVSTLISETMVLLENHPKMNSNIEVDIITPEDDIYIRGDIFQIKQVILNLCLNSIDAMPNGGSLTINLGNNLPPEIQKKIDPEILKKRFNSQYVAFHIHDTGCGIVEEYRDQIFTPFFSTKDQGTGLGLAIAYRIVEEHDGLIDYHTEEGVGTIFSVILPQESHIVAAFMEDKADGHYISRR